MATRLGLEYNILNDFRYIGLKINLSCQIFENWPPRCTGVHFIPLQANSLYRSDSSVILKRDGAMGMIGQCTAHVLLRCLNFGSLCWDLIVGSTQISGG